MSKTSLNVKRVVDLESEKSVDFQSGWGRNQSVQGGDQNSIDWRDPVENKLSFDALGNHLKLLENRKMSWGLSSAPLPRWLKFLPKAEFSRGSEVVVVLREEMWRTREREKKPSFDDGAESNLIYNGFQ